MLFSNNKSKPFLIDKKSLIEKIKIKKSIIIDARPESRYKGKIDEPRPNLKKVK